MLAERNKPVTYKTPRAHPNVMRAGAFMYPHTTRNVT